MAKRLITSVIAIAVFIPFLVYSHTAWFTGIIAFLSFVSAYEILKCTGFQKNIIVSVLSYAVAVLIPILSRITADESEFFAYAFVILFMYLFAMLAVSVFEHKSVNLKDSAVAFVGCAYSTIGLSMILTIRDLPQGKYIYLLIFLYAWISDSFAYFTGRAIGKHKLIPEVSPKKTVEGAVGGVIFTAVFSVIYGYAVSSIFDISAGYITLVVIGVVAALVSQCGDLILSQLKRCYNIKDFGILFPGHGGVLDRFDSVIAVAPFIYFMSELIPLDSMFGV